MSVLPLIDSSSTPRARPTASSVYYDEGYIAAAALLEPGAQWHLWRHRSAMIPLIIRPLPAHLGHGFDVISPYDFSGPQIGEEDVSDVYAALCDWANRNDIVSGFFRFHPLIGNPPLWSNFDGFKLVHASDNVVMHLPNPDTISKQCKPSVAQHIRFAKRERTTCQISEASQLALDRFVPLYWVSIKRLSGNPYYLFPRKFFDRLASALPKQVLIAEATVNGETAASIVVLLDGPQAYYYLACSSDIGRKVRGMNMLIVETARHLCELGATSFHLGGGSPTLRQFKKRFAPNRTPYFVGKIIFDQSRYARLSLGQETGFFPAYRAPEREAFASQAKLRTTSEAV